MDQLVGVIQRKTGEARERVEQYLNELTSGGGTMGKVAETVRNYAHQASDSIDEVSSRASDFCDGVPM